MVTTVTDSQPHLTNPALDTLGVFLGDWDIEISSFEADPTALFRGQASFHWLEGGAFLVMQSHVPETDFPRTTSVIGPDDAAEFFGMLYYDSRGVSRIYQMTIDEKAWKLWRDFPGFPQRFNAEFNEDHTILMGSWEKSTDGKKWEHDFDIKYTKTSK